MSNQEKQNASRTIEVKLTVPKIGWLEKFLKKLARLFAKKWVRLVAVVALFVAISLGVLYVTKTFDSDVKNTTNENQPPLVSEQDRTAQVPFYETLMPTGKTIEQLGGWTRMSPSDRNAVFGYTDSIENNRIVVSQQPLPEDFREDVEAQVEALAKGYKATEKITVGGLTVHIAKSAKGPQSIVFAKKGLLVLIRSSVTISNDQWIGYISSLQ